MIKYFLALNILLISLSCDVEAKYIYPDSSVFFYSGRFSVSKTEAVADWSGSSIEFRFKGEKLDLLIKSNKNLYLNLFVDSIKIKVLNDLPGNIYTIDSLDKEKWHTIVIQKRTEGDYGDLRFRGINIYGNSEVKAISPEIRKLEFIGNSITCGYGTEGKSKNEHFKASTENVNKSYAFITGRAFKSQVRTIAHSGLGVVRNYGDKQRRSTKRPTMPMRFNRLFDKTNEKWNFKQWTPDAVVINLGTNDYSTKPYPVESDFVEEYDKLISHVMGLYGNIPIFCLCGPMKDEPAHRLIKSVVDNRRNKDFKNVYFIGIPLYLLNTSTDLGSDWHPSCRGQKKIAAHIVPVMANVLNWNYNNKEFVLDNP